MSEDKDRVFFRNYITIIGLLAVMVVIFIIFSRVFGVRDKAYIAEREPIVNEITAPIGKVSIEGQEEPAAAAKPAQTAAVDTGSTVSTPAEKVDPGKKVFD